MHITIDVRRVLTLSALGFAAVFMAAVSTGCAAGYASQRSRTTYADSEGRYSVLTHEGSAKSLGVTLPVMLAGGGYAGYGQPIVGGGNLCMVHPDYCGTVVTVMPTVQPGAPIPYGAVADELGRYGYGSDSKDSDSAVSGRVKSLEDKTETNRQVLIRDHRNRKVIVGYLGSALVLNPQSCGYITANPESLVIDGDPELTKQVRAEVLTKCAGIVGKKENK